MRKWWDGSDMWGRERRGESGEGFEVVRRGISMFRCRSVEGFYVMAAFLPFIDLNRWSSVPSV